MKEYLPLGTVVVLKNGQKKIMIYGRKQISIKTKVEYDYIKSEDEFYLVMSSDNFEAKLENYHVYKNLSDLGLETYGIKKEQGAKILDLISKVSDYFLVMINHKNNEEGIIKLYCDEDNQYIYKLVYKKYGEKVVVANKNSDEIINSILYI